nr:hypothetical protein [uncultured Desulfobacter sp.]
MKNLKNRIIEISVTRHKRVLRCTLLITLAACAFFPMVKMDIDPENMLEKDELARVFHNEAKKQFNLSDTVVIGVINEEDPDGVFNPGTLGRIFELTGFHTVYAGCSFVGTNLFPCPDNVVAFKDHLH